MESTENLIIEARAHLATEINNLKELEKQVAPPAVQELVLARRDLESSRMRLGVALTYLKGEDPFKGK